MSKPIKIKTINPNSYGEIIICGQPVISTTMPTCESVGSPLWDGLLWVKPVNDSFEFQVCIKETFYPIGSGSGGSYTASKGITISDNDIQHTNSVIPLSSPTFVKVSYDAQGHITNCTQVSLSDIENIGLDLSGGAVNQVLAKRSSQDYDFKWVTQHDGGDDTGSAFIFIGDYLVSDWSVEDGKYVITIPQTEHTCGTDPYIVDIRYNYQQDLNILHDLSYNASYSYDGDIKIISSQPFDFQIRITDLSTLAFNRVGFLYIKEFTSSDLGYDSVNNIYTLTISHTEHKLGNKCQVTEVSKLETLSANSTVYRYVLSDRDINTVTGDIIIKFNASIDGRVVVTNLAQNLIPSNMFVRFDDSQTLSSSEKSQARSNIDAEVSGSAEEVLGTPQDTSQDITVYGNKSHINTIQSLVTTIEGSVDTLESSVTTLGNSVTTIGNSLDTLKNYGFQTYNATNVLSSNDDFNNCTTVGTYAVRSDTIASTISNMPEQTGGILFVYNVLGQNYTNMSGYSRYLVQEFTNWKSHKWIRDMHTTSQSTSISYGQWIRIDNAGLTEQSSSVTLESGWELYDSGNDIVVRKQGNVVYMRGVISPTQTITLGVSATKVGQIDNSSFYPSELVYALCQGSERSSWFLQVNAAGNIFVSRHRDSNATDYTTVSPSSYRWFPFSVSWII